MTIITLKVITSLLFVVFLMYAILKLVQKYSKFGSKLGSSSLGLKIEGVLYVDENTKIVCLQRAGNNYILAVNKNNTTVIDKYEAEK